MNFPCLFHSRLVTAAEEQHEFEEVRIFAEGHGATCPRGCRDLLEGEQDRRDR